LRRGSGSATIARILKRKKSALKTSANKSRREPIATKSAKVSTKSASKATSKAAVKTAAKAPRGRRTGGPRAAAGDSALAPRPKDSKRLQEARSAGEAAIEAALDKKALVPVLIDVSGQATYTDFIAILSGRSDRQVDAIADHIIDAMKARGLYLLGREGSGNGRWTLLDFGDLVVHVFYHPVREFYDIESLWIDAPRVSLKVPPEAMHVQEDTIFYERP
jgi:ribosome-associated protein